MSAAALIAAPTTLETARRHHARGNLLHAAQAYREILLNDPRSQAALLGLSLIARQSNQQQAALHMAHAALAAGPGLAVAWANLADILAALHQPARAEPIFRHALRLDPGLAAAHYGLGNCLALREDFAAALPSFHSAAQLAPSIPEFHFALGFAQGKLGQHAQAIAAYRRAVTLRPGFASAWLNLGVELIADGRDSLAHPCYRQALAAAGNPNTQISAHLNLGHLARRRQRFPQAEAHYNAALALASAQPLPENHLSEIRLSEVHVAFTYLHLEQQHFPTARESLQSAESADPTRQNPEIPNVLGILLLAEHTAQPPMAQPPMRGSDSVPAGMPDWTKGTGFSPYIHRDQDDGASAPEGSTLLHQAIAAFQQAEALGHKTAASNRGNALLRLGHCQEALAAHQAALTRDPCHPGLRYNLALTQLRLGDYAHGWPNYEIRWQFREVHPHPRRLRQPRWQGEALPAGATLLLYAEQGLGDTLQFVRSLALVAERLAALTEGPGDTHLASKMGGASKIHLILEVQPPLTRLLQQSIASLVRSHGITVEVIPPGSPLSPFTHHCPLMSLPAIFQTTLETVRSPIPYLQADPEQAQSRAVELANLGAPPLSSTIGPLIGLNWAGNPNYRADHERSTHLLTFLPLLQLPGIHWVSLHKGEAAAQIGTLPAEIPLLDGCSRDRDLADTAALIANLDLVLTTDTAIAHLAGALGKPLWLLLPWQSDWRWMQDRLTTPWYPTARLFRQSSPNAWPELISRVAAELAAWLAALRKPPATPL